MSNPLAVRTKIDPKAINPLTSKKGTFSITQPQAQYFLKLLALVPSKGSFAIHKARTIAVAGPQLTDWDTARIDLVKEHALTEPVDSEHSDAGVRVLSYSQEDVAAVREEARASALASNMPVQFYLPAVGEAKFKDGEARLAFAQAFEALTKELLIVWDLAAQANMHKAISACLTAFSDDRCPLIEDADVFTFERLLEEMEVALG